MSSKAGRNSNTFKILCISSLSASLKKIRSKATEKIGNIDFLDIQGKLTMLLFVESEENSQVIQAFMVVLVNTRKNEEDLLKMKALEWSQHFSHCKSIIVIFFQTLIGN